MMNKQFAVSLGGFNSNTNNIHIAVGIIWAETLEDAESKAKVAMESRFPLTDFSHRLCDVMPTGVVGTDGKGGITINVITVTDGNRKG